MASFREVTGWGSGWTIGPITDESGISHIVTLTPTVYQASSGRVGIGTNDPNSALQVSGPIATALVSKTSAYTLGASDSVVLANATSAAFTLTLPTAVGISGRTYTLKKIDSSANAVTVATTASQTIDSATTLSLSSQWQRATVVSDGTNWMIVA
jgi:hypothetical protein